MGTDRVFAADLQALRPQAGQADQRGPDRRRPGRVRRSSRRTPATRTPGCRTPIRCAARPRCTARPGTPPATPPSIADRELASSIDNPVVLPDGRVESNGNFHGAPVAAVLDFLAISVADVAGICERRTDRMLDASRSQGLPPFLAHEVGVDSGHMIAQYTQAGHRLGTEAAGRSGLGRFDPVVGDAGGPRVDGLARRTQTAPLGRRSAPGHRHRDPHRGKGTGFPGAADARPGHRRGRGRRADQGGRTRARPPPRRSRSTPSSTCSPTDAIAALQHSNFATPTSRMPTAFPTGRTEMTTALPSTAGTACRTRPATCPGRPRHHADRQELVDRGAVADALQQPRSRGRRGTGQARRLRRHRQGRAQLGQLRRDLPHPDRPSSRTRPCWCSPVNRSVCCAPTSGRRGC